jgi:hypothetical protein
MELNIFGNQLAPQFSDNSVGIFDPLNETLVEPGGIPQHSQPPWGSIENMPMIDGSTATRGEPSITYDLMEYKPSKHRVPTEMKFMLLSSANSSNVALYYTMQELNHLLYRQYEALLRQARKSGKKPDTEGSKRKRLKREVEELLEEDVVTPHNFWDKFSFLGVVSDISEKLDAPDVSANPVAENTVIHLYGRVKGANIFSSSEKQVDVKPGDHLGFVVMYMNRDNNLHERDFHSKEDMVYQQGPLQILPIAARCSYSFLLCGIPADTDVRSRTWDLRAAHDRQIRSYKRYKAGDDTIMELGEILLGGARASYTQTAYHRGCTFGSAANFLDILYGRDSSHPRIVAQIAVVTPIAKAMRIYGGLPPKEVVANSISVNETKGKSVAGSNMSHGFLRDEYQLDMAMTVPRGRVLFGMLDEDRLYHDYLF